MQKINIPAEPGSFHFKIDHFWDGKDCTDAQHHAQGSIAHSEKGIVIQVKAKIPTHNRTPDAPEGARVDGLWDYDVVEVFLVGENSHYIEIELGPKGQWLVFGFDGIRQRSHDYADFKPEMTYKTQDDRWESTILIPWDMVPSDLVRMNAFVVSDNNFLAMSPVPGEKPDFHQPSLYPTASLDEQE